MGGHIVRSLISSLHLHTHGK